MRRYRVCSFRRNRIAPGFEAYVNCYHACRFDEGAGGGFGYTLTESHAATLDKAGVDRLLSCSHESWLEDSRISEV